MKLFPGWTAFPEARGNSFVRLCCHRSVTFSGQPVRNINLLRVLVKLSDPLNPTYSSVEIPGWVQSGRLARSPFTCTRGRQSMSLRRNGNWLCAGLPAANSFFAKRVYHPGTKRDPFIFNAANANKRQIIGRFENAVRRVFEEVK